MCMTTGPAKLTDTLIYVGEATRDNKTVHVIAYQNQADNRSKGPNAMVLPFPAAASMGPENIVDTTDYKGVLKVITAASKIQSFSMSRGLTKGMFLGADDVQIFKSGSYMIALASDPRQIKAVLPMMPVEVRPEISEEFLTGYAELYPNHQVVVCCWDGKLKPEPLLWWYEPKDLTHLFVPTVDAHDGKPPKSGAVFTDHVISVGSTIKPTGNKVAYPPNYDAEIPAEVRALLPTHVHGGKLKPYWNNGDGFVEIEPMNCGEAPIFERRFPGQSTHGTIALNGWAEDE